MSLTECYASFTEVDDLPIIKLSNVTLEIAARLFERVLASTGHDLYLMLTIREGVSVRYKMGSKLNLV